MEVCPATPLLSRSSAVPIHWHSGFCVQRRRNHQLRDEFLDHLLHDGNSRGTTDKSNIMNIALAVLLSSGKWVRCALEKCARQTTL